MTEQEIWELRENLKNVEHGIYLQEIACTLSNGLVRLRKQRDEIRNKLADQGIFT